RPDAREQRVVVDDVDRVPAHVRDLERGIGGLDGFEVTPDPAESRRHTEFKPTLRRQLCSDTNSKKRPQLVANGPLQRLAHASYAVDPGLAVGEGTNAR